MSKKRSEKMGFQRARGEEQKAKRIREIMEATIAIYETEGYDGVTFSKICKGLSFSRINMYNYFKCKEDIFLLILLEDIRIMVEDADRTFPQAEENPDIFVDKWCEMLLRQKRLLSLFSVLNTIILRGASDDAHREFRERMYQNYKVLHSIVNRALPQLTEDMAMKFVEYENSYAMTIFPASIEYKQAQGISIFPKVGYGTGEFIPQVKPFIYCILRGLLAESQQ